jgi:hypothetical protein
LELVGIVILGTTFGAGAAAFATVVFVSGNMLVLSVALSKVVKRCYPYPGRRAVPGAPRPQNALQMRQKPTYTVPPGAAW